MNHTLEMWLLVAAGGQLCFALMNLQIVRIMHWEPDVAQMSLLVRQVFYVHSWFISATLLIFAVLTWRFAPQMALGNEAVYRWLAGGIGIFWSIRAILQVTYYSSSHWRGIPSRTTVHILLLIIYPGWAVIYLTAGLGLLK